MTNRLKSEDELQKTRELQNAILESVPGMIYMYNDLGELLFWNKWHETMTGYNKEELYLKKLTDWFENDEQSLAAIKQGLQDMKTKGFGETEAYLECKDKTKIPLYFTARLFKLDGKDYFVGMGVDISNRVAAENKLKVLNHTLEEKVIERTQELSDANIELSEVNQELTAMNEEMQAMNEELSNSNEKMIKIIPMSTLSDVLEHILINGNKKDNLINHIKKLGNHVADNIPESTIKTPNAH